MNEDTNHQAYLDLLTLVLLMLAALWSAIGGNLTPIHRRLTFQAAKLWGWGESTRRTATSRKPQTPLEETPLNQRSPPARPVWGAPSAGWQGPPGDTGWCRPPSRCAETEGQVKLTTNQQQIYTKRPFKKNQQPVIHVDLTIVQSQSETANQGRACCWHHRVYLFVKQRVDEERNAAAGGTPVCDTESSWPRLR